MLPTYHSTPSYTPKSVPSIRMLHMQCLLVTACHSSYCHHSPSLPVIPVTASHSQTLPVIPSHYPPLLVTTSKVEQAAQ